MTILTVLLTVLYWVAFCLILAVPLLYVLWYGSMLVALFRIGLNADMWTVDRNDPLTKVGEKAEPSKAILRELGPLEVVMVSFAGAYRYVAFHKGAAGFSVKGLENDKPGMACAKEEDWQLVLESENEVNPEKQVIQSRWGWWSPIYGFRRAVYTLTGRHVIRLWFPLFTSGPWAILQPELDTYERARPKGQVLRDHQHLVNQDKANVANTEQDSASVWNVRDTTDHRLVKFTHEYKTNSFPTRSGYEFKGVFALVFEVKNFHRAFRWKDWSRRINATIDEGFGAYMRPGKLDEVYAIDKSQVKSEKKDTTGSEEEGSRDGPEWIMQKLVESYLDDPKVKTFETVKVEPKDAEIKDGEEDDGRRSLLYMLGLSLTDVSLVDLVPADKETEAAVTALMAIIPEGENRATTAGLLLAAQAGALAGVDKEVSAAMASIIAAQQLSRAGKVDYLMGGSSGAPTVDQGMLNKVVKELNTDGGKK